MFTRLVNWYGKRVVYGVLGLVLVLLLTGGYFLFHKTTTVDVVTPSKKRVEVKEAGALGEESVALKTVGTVRAVSEARLQTESSGRVTAVNVAIGDHVSAGSVLASIENSRERASLLQAEGAYESAKASLESAQTTNAQSNISLAAANVAAQNAYRTAFTTGDDVIRNLSDELFSNPTTENPGVRIDSKGEAVSLIKERTALGHLLDSWNGSLATSDTSSVAEKIQLLTEAENDLTRIGAFVSQLSQLVSDADGDATFTKDVLASYKTRFGAARSRIDITLQSISVARASLRSTTQTAENGSVTSDSAGRIKQAQGVLASAQSAYEKTIVRSPISGVVNAFYLHENQFVGMNAPAAVVANNGALEITTSVSEEERVLIAVGNKVMINDTIEGTITRIAPAIDPQTGKIEIKISLKDEKNTTLQNGTTVSLSLAGVGTPKKVTELRVPLRALKITAEGPIAFSVKPDSTLEAHPVVLGALVGDVVVIQSGIDTTTKIVTDARGLKEGESVEVVTK